MNGSGNGIQAPRHNLPWRAAAVFGASTLIFGVLTLFAAPVAAKQCPRGQIFHVSKKMCMDRNEAIDLGIVHGKKSAAVKADPPKADEPTDASEAATPESPPERPPQPASGAADPPKPPASPYGELSLETFPKP